MDVCDPGPNPHQGAFGRYGTLRVRYGKGSRGSAPKRRNVATVVAWSAEVLEQHVEEIRPLYGRDEHPALFLTERGGRVTAPELTQRFAEAVERAGLPRELTPRALRHSYGTHLIEDGFDELFVGLQVGHLHASTTALYTAVQRRLQERGAPAGPAWPARRRAGLEPGPVIGVDYEWRLRLLLAERGVFYASDLHLLLTEHDVTLSESRVWRLVAGKPERLNLHTLMVLCDILDCSPNDLIRPVDAPEQRMPSAERQPTRQPLRRTAAADAAACRSSISACPRRSRSTQ